MCAIFIWLPEKYYFLTHLHEAGKAKIMQAVTHALNQIIFDRDLFFEKIHDAKIKTLTSGSVVFLLSEISVPIYNKSTMS